MAVPVTTGGTNFFPITGEVILSAYARIGIRHAEILQEHLHNARYELNYMQAAWACDGPLLWTVQLIPNALVAGQAVYSIPQNVVMILDAYISVSDQPGSGPVTYSDRIIWPISRTEWASTPNKTQQGSPTSFWFDRLFPGQVTLWPVPDGSEAFFNYFAYIQIQDAGISGATSPQVPYLWLDATVAGLAHRLSRIYALPLEPARSNDAEKAYQNARRQYVENVPLFIAPTTEPYFRI